MRLDKVLQCKPVKINGSTMLLTINRLLGVVNVLERGSNGDAFRQHHPAVALEVQRDYPQERGQVCNCSTCGWLTFDDL